MGVAKGGRRGVTRVSGGAEMNDVKHGNNMSGVDRVY
jgi:hypothetical protein